MNLKQSPQSLLHDANKRDETSGWRIGSERCRWWTKLVADNLRRNWAKLERKARPEELAILTPYPATSRKVDGFYYIRSLIGCPLLREETSSQSKEICTFRRGIPEPGASEAVGGLARKIERISSVPKHEETHDKSPAAPHKIRSEFYVKRLARQVHTKIQSARQPRHLKLSPVWSMSQSFFLPSFWSRESRLTRRLLNLPSVVCHRPLRKNGLDDGQKIEGSILRIILVYLRPSLKTFLKKGICLQANNF